MFRGKKQACSLENRHISYCVHQSVGSGDIRSILLSLSGLQPISVLVLSAVLTVGANRIYLPAVAEGVSVKFSCFFLKGVRFMTLAGKEQKLKLFCIGDIIRLSKTHRRKIMYRIDVLMIEPAKRDRDGTRWFSEAQVQEILNYSGNRRAGDGHARD